MLKRDASESGPMSSFLLPPNTPIISTGLFMERWCPVSNMAVQQENKWKHCCARKLQIGPQELWLCAASSVAHDRVNYLYRHLSASVSAAWVPWYGLTGWYSLILKSRVLLFWAQMTQYAYGIVWYNYITAGSSRSSQAVRGNKPKK